MPLTQHAIQPGTNIDFLRSEECTDYASARVFTAAAGKGCRHNAELGWLVWDGSRWKPDTEGHIYDLALTVGSHFRKRAGMYLDAKADPQLVKWILSWARHAESAAGIRDFLTLSEPGLHQPVDDFDTHPWLVNCRNCTLDFGNLEGALPKHYQNCDADYLTRVIPHDWNMGARRARWDAFLEQILPDPDVRDFVQRAVGYSMLGTTREQVFFILYGTGCNGKSVFLNTLRHVLGEYAQQGERATFLVSKREGPRNDLADLRGVRFLSAIETGDGKRLDEALVKSATGGDALRCRHLYHEAFTYVPGFRLWLATNYPPAIHGTDHAMWRRVRLIPFTTTISDAEMDRDLEAKLYKQPEGILDWCVEGAVHYLQHGLDAPAGVKVATESYRNQEDIIGRFLSDSIVSDAHGMVAKGELYAAFRSWAETQGEPLVSQRRVSGYLQERGVDSVRLAGGKHSWVGIRLNSDVTEKWGDGS